jgi:hypothetical protein
MAQTRRKRRTKHRGNAAGVVTARGRTTAPPKGAEKKALDRQRSREQRAARYDKPPSWKSSTQRALITCVILFAVLMIIPGPKHNILAVGGLTLIAFVFYLPMGYMIDTSMYRRRQRRKLEGKDS